MNGKSDRSRKFSHARRRWLAGCAAGLAAPALAADAPAPADAGAASAAVAAAKGSRLALLLGNRSYPEPFDLPPIPKNVHDVHAALEKRGFLVSDALDLDLAGSRQALDRFIAQANASPPSSTLFFYFSGHGAQVDALNLLLPAGLNPSSPRDAVRQGSLQLLDDIVRRLPERPDGLIIAVIDACRTSLKADDAGLNQVKAPPGCLIAFSTGAGKPAIAPAVATQNTFYTASLVRLLGSVADETSFPDLFRLVKADVHQVMSNYPIEIIRRVAQDPFIADDSHVAPPVGIESILGTAAQRSEQEANDWAALRQLTWPSQVRQQADAFLKNYPDSKLAAGATVARDGATDAVKVLQRPEIRLQRTAFQVRNDMDTSQVADLVKAGRGDKDAAARMAQRFANFGGSATAMARYEGWLQYAAGLGNGIASFELALFYRRQDQPLPAAQYESRARELGYTPPLSLDNSRK